METFDDAPRRLRTDVGPDTIDQLTVIAEQLCCEYNSRPADELLADAHHQLAISALNNAIASLYASASDR